MVRLHRTRPEITRLLRARDGDHCQHPDCGKPIDFTVTEGRRQSSIDHWYPQSWCRQHGWTEDEIWDLGNLKLFHKGCNSRKSNLLPNEDGSLPDKPQREFRYRRERRAGRLEEPCPICDNGHNLFVGEICEECGVYAKTFPKWAKVSVPECSHSETWCWACSIGIIERAPASDSVFGRNVDD